MEAGDPLNWEVLLPNSESGEVEAGRRGSIISGQCRAKPTASTLPRRRNYWGMVSTGEEAKSGPDPPHHRLLHGKTVASGQMHMVSCRPSVPLCICLQPFPGSRMAVAWKYGPTEVMILERLCKGLTKFPRHVCNLPAQPFVAVSTTLSQSEPFALVSPLAGDLAVRG